MADSNSIQNHLQDQIDDLQHQLAYQEDLLSTLNKTVAEQSDVIQRLTAHIKQSDKRLSSAIASFERDQQEKPPHY